MNQVSINKILTPTFEIISQVLKPRKFRVAVGTVKYHPFNGRDLTLRGKDSSFNFQIVTLVKKGIQSYTEFKINKKTNVSLRNSKFKLFVQGADFLVNSISYPGFDDPEAKPTKLVKGEITSISTRKSEFYKSSRFYRAALPISNDLTFLHNFTGERYLVESKPRFAPLLRLTILATEYHLFTMSNDKKQNFLIIDCLSKSDYTSFLKIVNSVLLAYAFLKGIYVGTNLYVMAFSSSNLKKPLSIKTHLLVGGDKGFPIHITNPYNIEQIANRIKYKTDDKGMVKYNDRHLDKYRKPFPYKVFSQLCELIYSKYGILRGTILFVNNKAIGLELRVPALFVAIENITRVLSINSDSSKILNNSLVETSLKQIIKESVKKVKEIEKANQPIDALGKESREYKANFARIYGKLHDLNRGSNNKKLIEPFSNIGYTLSDEEQELLIRKRNVFLHGEDFMTLEQDYDKEFREMFHISLKLQKLIAVLLLKKAGYSGFILNNAKVHERISGRKLAEPYFIMI